jgi:hypothetical protein
MNSSEKAANRISTIDGLDQVRMNPEQRRLARASVRQSELLVESLVRGNELLRQVFGFIRRGIGTLARHSKVSPLAPERRLP